MGKRRSITLVLALALTLAVPAQAKWTFTCKTALLATLAISLGCGALGPCVRGHLHKKQLVSVESKPLIVGGQPVKLKNGDFHDAAELLVQHIILKSGERRHQLERVRLYLLCDDENMNAEIQAALRAQGIAPEILEDRDAFSAEFSDCTDSRLLDLLAFAMRRVHAQLVANTQASGVGAGLSLPNRDISSLTFVEFAYLYSNHGDEAFFPVRPRAWTLKTDAERRAEAERAVRKYFTTHREGLRDAPFDRRQNLEDFLFEKLQSIAKSPIRPSAETADTVLKSLHEEMVAAHARSYQRAWKPEADPYRALAEINLVRGRSGMAPLVYSETLSRHCAMTGPPKQQLIDISRIPGATGAAAGRASSVEEGMGNLLRFRVSSEPLLNSDSQQIGFAFYEGWIYVIVTR